MMNRFLKEFISTLSAIVFIIILPLASVFIIPEIAFRLSGGNSDIAIWTFFIYATLLLSIVITIMRLADER